MCNLGDGSDGLDSRIAVTYTGDLEVPGISVPALQMQLISET